MASARYIVHRVAAIDVGTNTVMCLVADVHSGRGIDVLADDEHFVRLGEGVDETGRLTDAVMDHVLACLAECKTTALRFNAQHVVICATSASRDATNTGKLIERVRDELGLEYRVISGDEEAALSFRGALAMVHGATEACVLDVGGGSTELTAGRVKDIRYRASVDMGSVRLTERFFSIQPPPVVQIRLAERDVRAVLSMIPQDTFLGLPLIEGGGTARVLVSLIGADEQAPAIPHCVVREWRDRLLTMSADEVRALNPDILTGREDIAPAALLILDTVMQRFGFERFIAGQGGLRHGIALATADAS